jgi:hypothetical protein
MTNISKALIEWADRFEEAACLPAPPVDALPADGGGERLNRYLAAQFALISTFDLVSERLRYLHEAVYAQSMLLATYRQAIDEAKPEIDALPVHPDRWEQAIGVLRAWATNILETAINQHPAPERIQ